MKRVLSLLLVLLLTLPCFASAELVSKADVEYNSLVLVTASNDDKEYLGNTVTTGGDIGVLAAYGLGIDGKDLTYTLSNKKVLEYAYPYETLGSCGFAFHALKAGTCTVTIKSIKDSSIKATAKITVIDPAKLKLKSVSFLGDSRIFRATQKTILLDPTWLNTQDSMSVNDLLIEPGQLAGECKAAWKSSNPKVIKMEKDGTFTYMGYGTTKITATVTHAASKTKKTATLTLTLVDMDGLHSASFRDFTSPTVPEIKNVKISTIAKDLDLRKNLDIVPGTIADSCLVEWTSGSKKVADFADPTSGVITINKEGTTKVTATVTCGEVKKKATLTLKVYDPNKPTKVTVDTPKRTVLRVTTPKLALYLGVNNTIEFAPQYTVEAIKPDPALYDVTFANSNGKVGTIDSKTGVFTVKGKGTTKVTVNVKYTNYGATTTKKAAWTVTVKDLDADLTKLYGKKPATLNAFFGTKGYKMPYPLPNTSKADMYFWDTHEDFTTFALYSAGKMKLIGFNEDCPYNVLGIEHGTSATEAESILMSKGYTLSDVPAIMEEFVSTTLYVKGKTGVALSVKNDDHLVRDIAYGDTATLKEQFESVR